MMDIEDVREEMRNLAITASLKTKRLKSELAAKQQKFAHERCILKVQRDDALAERAAEQVKCHELETSNNRLRGELASVEATNDIQHELLSAERARLAFVENHSFPNHFPGLGYWYGDVVKAKRFETRDAAIDAAREKDENKI